MIRQPLYATSLHSIGYDDEERILEVEFKDGSINQYLNVPYRIYQELLSASAPDSYFDTNVRNSYYLRRIH